VRRPTALLTTSLLSFPPRTRLCTKDATLKGSGKRIPAGTRVLVPFFVMNRMPDVWPEPNKFDPERFADEARFLVPEKGFIPFGYGSRTCIGYTMAQMEAYVIFSLLLKRYRFEAVGGGYKPRLAAGISLTSGNGIQVRVLRRGGAGR
jgi:cytochrome P450